MILNNSKDTDKYNNLYPKKILFFMPAFGYIEKLNPVWKINWFLSHILKQLEATTSESLEGPFYLNYLSLLHKHFVTHIQKIKL